MKKLTIGFLTLLTLSCYSQVMPHPHPNNGPQVQQQGGEQQVQQYGGHNPIEQIQKIMECEAVGSKDGENLFEVKSDIYNSKVSSQGTTITSTLGGEVKTASLTLTSKDKFQDNFSISIFVKHGEKIIESERLSDLSLSSGTRVFGINKRLQGYEMILTCNKL
jgi:hypothetical protein